MKVSILLVVSAFVCLTSASPKSTSTVSSTSHKSKSTTSLTSHKATTTTFSTSHRATSNTTLFTSHTATPNTTLFTSHTATSNTTFFTSHPAASNTTSVTNHTATSNTASFTSYKFTSTTSFTSYKSTSTTSSASYKSTPTTSSASYKTTSITSSASHKTTSTTSSASYKSTPTTSSASYKTTSITSSASHKTTSTTSSASYKSTPTTSSASYKTTSITSSASHKTTSTTSPASYKTTSITSPASHKNTSTTSPASHKTTSTTSPASHKTTSTTSPASHKTTSTTSPASHKTTSTTSSASHKTTSITSPASHNTTSTSSPASHKTTSTTSPAIHKTTSTTSPASHKTTSTAPISCQTNSPPPGAGNCQFGGINIAGFDFGCDINGNDNLADVNGPIPGSQYNGVSQMQHFVQKGGLNIFRLPVGWQFLLNNNLGGSLNQKNFAAYDELVQGCLNTGAHCIIDIHNYARWNGGIIGQGGPSNSQFANLWSQLASKYKNDDRVVMGLVNEPHDIPNMYTWASTCQAAINAIRAAGATSQMILVPGDDYTSAGSWLADSSAALMTVKDTDGSTDKIIFDLHKYLDAGNGGNSNDPCVTNNISGGFAPVATYLRCHGRQAMLTETNGPNNSGCVTYLNQQLSYLNENSDVYLGFLGWAAGSFSPNSAMVLTPYSDGSDQLNTREVFYAQFHPNGKNM